MHDAWRNYANAPKEGAIICPSNVIKEGKAHYMEMMSNDESFPVIATRLNGRIYCYVNACPHQYLPLNYQKLILTHFGMTLSQQRKKKI